METVTIDRGALRGMLNFAAKKDIRYYLNSVLVEATPEKTRLVATNGHILGIYTSDAPKGNQNTGNVSVILPRELCECIKAEKNIPLVTLEVDGDNVTLVDCGQRIGGKRIDGKFPDYTAVIPATADEHEPGNFNPELVMQFAKFAKAIGRRAKFVHLTQNGLYRAALVTIDGERGFVGVIMPLHMNDAITADIGGARSHLFTPAPKVKAPETKEVAT